MQAMHLQEIISLLSVFSWQMNCHQNFGKNLHASVKISVLVDAKNSIGLSKG